MRLQTIILAVLLLAASLSHAEDYTFHIYDSPDLSVETFSDSDVYLFRVSSTNVEQAMMFFTNSAALATVNISNSMRLVNASRDLPYTNGIDPIVTILTNISLVKFLNTTTAVEIIRALNNVTITNIGNVTNSIRNGGSAG